MEILALADIHGDIENLIRLIDKLSSLKFDVIVCVGDLTNAEIPIGFEREDIVKIIIEELRTLGRDLLCLPGNFDKDVITLLEKEKVNLHGKGIIKGNVGFYGFGGARTPFNTPLEPSEEEIEEGLSKGFEEVKNCRFKVQVTHMPPLNTKLDLLYTGAHVGSKIVRKFIEDRKPSVAISSHIHEARGIDELNGSKLINPGRFPEGYVGIVKLEEKNIDVKIINLI